MASQFGFISLTVLLSLVVHCIAIENQAAVVNCAQEVVIDCLAPVLTDYGSLPLEALIALWKKEGLHGHCKRAQSFLKCASTGVKRETSYCSEVPAPVISILQDVLSSEEKALKYVCQDQFTTMNKIHYCLLDNYFGVLSSINTCIEPSTYDYLAPCEKISKSVNCMVKTVKDTCKTSKKETSVARKAYQKLVAPVNGLAGCQQLLNTRQVQDFMNFILKR